MLRGGRARDSELKPRPVIFVTNKLVVQASPSKHCNGAGTVLSIEAPHMVV